MNPAAPPRAPREAPDEPPTDPGRSSRWILAAVGIVLVFFLAAAARAYIHTEPSPGAPDAALPAEPREGRVTVVAALNVGVFYQPEQEPTLWLGVGNWSFLPPSDDAVESRAFLDAWSHAARARFIKTGGAPVIITAYQSMEDAKNDTHPTGRVDAGFAHTYTEISVRMPSAQAYRVSIPLGVTHEIVVDTHTGRVLVMSQGAWMPGPLDEPLNIVIPDAEVLVEDEAPAQFGRV